MDRTLEDRLRKLNQTLKECRNNGVKMKDIAEITAVTPSVLSSLYSTVIPTYIGNLARGFDNDTAIKEALKMVNNISYKKLINTIDSLEQNTYLIEASNNTKINDSNDFFNEMEKEATSRALMVEQYSGIYLTYSRSSYKDALKVEPYLIEGIQKGKVMPRAAFKNTSNQEFWGIGVFSNQLGYILINELTNNRLGIRSISLQLPLFDKPKVLRGLYLSHDYNYNPYARRIIFVKQSDDFSIENFAKYKARIINIEDFDEEEHAYYKYTCEDRDYITSLMYASPEPYIDDLRKEKELLKIY